MNSQLPNPRKVIYNMLIARNYNVSENFIDDIDEKFLTSKVDDPDNKLYVFFPNTTTKVGVSTIRNYVKDMQDNQVIRAIIVVKDAITAFAKQVFVDANPLIIECFKENELYIDKLNHVLVPKHELIDEESKKELLKNYKIKEWQLPKILSSDPIARYFGAKKGQVFKITRHSENSNEYIYYRLVC